MLLQQNIFEWDLSGIKKTFYTLEESQKPELIVSDFFKTSLPMKMLPKVVTLEAQKRVFETEIITKTESAETANPLVKKTYFKRNSHQHYGTKKKQRSHP